MTNNEIHGDFIGNFASFDAYADWLATESNNRPGYLDYCEAAEFDASVTERQRRTFYANGCLLSENGVYVLVPSVKAGKADGFDLFDVG